MYADSDEDSCLLIDSLTGMEVMKLQAGDVSVNGHVVNGPGLGAPVKFTNLYCQSISAGAVLYIYLL